MLFVIRFTYKAIKNGYSVPLHTVHTLRSYPFWPIEWQSSANIRIICKFLPSQYLKKINPLESIYAVGWTRFFFLLAWHQTNCQHIKVYMLKPVITINVICLWSVWLSKQSPLRRTFTASIPSIWRLMVSNMNKKVAFFDRNFFAFYRHTSRSGIYVWGILPAHLLWSSSFHMNIQGILNSDILNINRAHFFLNTFILINVWIDNNIFIPPTGYQQWSVFISCKAVEKSNYDWIKRDSECEYRRTKTEYTQRRACTRHEKKCGWINSNILCLCRCCQKGGYETFWSHVDHTYEWLLCSSFPQLFNSYWIRPYL